MGLLTALGLTALGLLLLGGGGELLVRGAVTLSRRAGVTPAIVGLTVVSLGTSLPEMVVSLIAALGGRPDIAVGNVVGSNIMNVAFVLGLAALLFPLPVTGSLVKFEWPFMFLASAVFVLLVRDGILDKIEGGFFLIALVLFTGYMIMVSRSEVAAQERETIASEVSHLGGVLDRARGWLPSVLAVTAGIGLLVGGGKALVEGAVGLAQLAGMTERVIGLTVVAIGTSMPEVVTSVVAAYRRHTDMAVANVIGSNIFNLLGILGTTSVVVPITISPSIIASDVWWMLGTSFLLLPLMHLRRNLNRVEGGFLLGAYGVYLVALLS